MVVVIAASTVGDFVKAKLPLPPGAWKPGWKTALGLLVRSSSSSFSRGGFLVALDVDESCLERARESGER
jgi:hypothetical protein